MLLFLLLLLSPIHTFALPFTQEKIFIKLASSTHPQYLGTCPTSATEDDCIEAAKQWGITYKKYVKITSSPSSSKPHGCFFDKNEDNLYYNRAKAFPIVLCSSTYECFCSVTCSPGTYQNEKGKSSCKTCPDHTFSDVGASSCTLNKESCPANYYTNADAAINCD